MGFETSTFFGLNSERSLSSHRKIGEGGFITLVLPNVDGSNSPSSCVMMYLARIDHLIRILISGIDSNAFGWNGEPARSYWSVVLIRHPFHGGCRGRVRIKHGRGARVQWLPHGASKSRVAWGDKRVAARFAIGMEMVGLIRNKRQSTSSTEWPDAPSMLRRRDRLSGIVAATSSGSMMMYRRVA